MKGAAEEYLGAELMRPEARELALRRIAQAPVSKSQRGSMYVEWQIKAGVPFSARAFAFVCRRNEWDRSPHR